MLSQTQGAKVIATAHALLLIVTRVLDARKKKGEEQKSDDTPKIILPK